MQSVYTPLGVDLSPRSRSAYRPSTADTITPTARSLRPVGSVTPTPHRKRPSLLFRLSPFHRHDTDLDMHQPSLTAATSYPDSRLSTNDFRSTLRQPNPRLPDLSIYDPLMEYAKDRQWPIDEARPLCHPPVDTGISATARGAVAKSRIVVQRTPPVSTLSTEGMGRISKMSARRPSTAPTISHMHPFAVTPCERPTPDGFTPSRGKTPQKVPQIVFDNPSPFTSIAPDNKPPPFGYGSKAPGPDASTARTNPAYTGPRPPPRPARSRCRPAPSADPQRATPHTPVHMPAPKFPSPTFGDNPTFSRPTHIARPAPSPPNDDEEMGFKTMIRKDSQEVAEQIKRELASASTEHAAVDVSAMPIDGLPNVRKGSVPFVSAYSDNMALPSATHPNRPLRPLPATCSEESLVRMQNLHNLIHPQPVTMLPIGANETPLSSPKQLLPYTSRPSTAPFGPYSRITPRSPDPSNSQLANDTQYASIRSWLCTIVIQLQLLDISKGQLYQHNSALIDTCGYINNHLVAGGASSALTFTILSNLADSLNAWWRDEAQILNDMREATFAQYDVYLAQHDALMKRAESERKAAEAIHDGDDEDGGHGTITVSRFEQSKHRIDGRESLLQARLDENDLQCRIKRWAREQVSTPPVCGKLFAADGSSTWGSSIAQAAETCAKTLALIKSLESRDELRLGTAKAVRHEMRKAGWITQVPVKSTRRKMRPSQSQAGPASSSDSSDPAYGQSTPPRAIRYERLRDVHDPVEPATTSSKVRGRSLLGRISRMFGRPSSRGVDHFQAVTPDGPFNGDQRYPHSSTNGRPTTASMDSGRKANARVQALGRLRGAVQSTIELVSGSSTSRTDLPTRRESRADEHGIPTVDATRVRRYKEEKIASGMQRRASFGASSMLNGLFGSRQKDDPQVSRAYQHNAPHIVGDMLHGDVRQWAAAVETPTPRQSMFRRDLFGLEVEADEEEAGVAVWSGTARRLSDMFDDDPRTSTRAQDPLAAISNSPRATRVSAMSLFPPLPAYAPIANLDPSRAIEYDQRPRRNTPPSDRSHNVLTPAHHSPEPAPGSPSQGQGVDAYGFGSVGHSAAFDRREQGRDDETVVASPARDAVESRARDVRPLAIVQTKALQGYSAQFSFVAHYTPDREGCDARQPISYGGESSRGVPAGPCTPGARVGLRPALARRPGTSTSTSAAFVPQAMQTPRAQQTVSPAAQRPRVLVRDERRDWIRSRSGLPTEWHSSPSLVVAAPAAENAAVPGLVRPTSSIKPATLSATTTAPSAPAEMARGTHTPATVSVSASTHAAARASTAIHTHRTGRTEDWEREENSPERYQTRMETLRAAMEGREDRGSAVFVDLSGRPRIGKIG